MHSTNENEAVDQMVYQNPQPGDYSLPSGSRRDVYSSHMIGAAPQHLIGKK